MLHLISAKSEQTARGGATWALACRIVGAVLTIMQENSVVYNKPCVFTFWFANGVFPLDFAM